MRDFKIVCLMTVARAGSKLFQSLLDGHPQIICFPRTLRFDTFWQSTAHKKADPGYIVDEFIRLDPRFFDGRKWSLINKFDKADELGENRDQTFIVDTSEFRRLALKQIGETKLTRAHLFLSLHMAYHLASGRQLPKNGLILYHIHDTCLESELAACLEDFPDQTSVIMTTRHPLSGLTSVTKWMEMQNIVSFGGLLFYTRTALTDAHDLMQNFPGLNLRVVPLEKLNRQHESHMRALTSWAGIDWNDSLMTPTMHGMLWLGNAKTSKGHTDPNFPQFSPNGFLERKDERFFCTLFPGRMERYGYLKPPERNDHTFSSVTLYLAPLLPTANGWAIFVSSINPVFWWRTYLNVKSETFTRLRDYADNKTTRLNQISSDKIHLERKSSLSLHLKTLRQLFMRMVWTNPAVGFYMYLRRARTQYEWIRKTRHNPEQPPMILYEENRSNTFSDKKQRLKQRPT